MAKMLYLRDAHMSSTCEDNQRYFLITGTRTGNYPYRSICVRVDNELEVETFRNAYGYTFNLWLDEFKGYVLKNIH